MNTLNSKLRILNKAQEKEEETPLSERYKNKTIGKEFREDVWGEPAAAIAGAVGNAYQDTMWKARRGMLGPHALIGSHGIDLIGKMIPDLPVDKAISHGLHNWGGIDKTTADVIGQGGEIFLTRKAIKAASKVTPKSLGISQTTEQLPKRIDAAAPPRKLINVTKSNAYQDLVRDYPANSMGGFVPKASLASETYGGLVEKYPWLLKNRGTTAATTDLTDRSGQTYAMAYDNTPAEMVERLYPDLKSRKRTVEREKLLSTEGTELRELITEHQQAIENAKKVTIHGKEFSVAPYSKEEMTAKVRRYAELKDQLGFKNATSYTDDLGAFLLKDGSVARLDSKGELVSTKGLLKRLATQESFPTDKEFDDFVSVYGNFKDNKRRALSNVKNPELHHQVVLENQYGVLGKTLDKAGEFVARPAEFMRKITGILKKRGHNLGDVNANLLTMSEWAHRIGELSPHITLASATDFAKPHTYVEAEQIFTELHDGTKKWLDVEVIDIKKGTYKLKDGDKVIPNKLIKSRGNYKVYGNEYDKGQKQGLSIDTRKMLASITDPNKLADAYELFALDTGAKEVMEGAAALGSYAYDKAADLDPLTLKLREEAIPSMIKYIDTLLKLEQYKGHQLLIDLKDRFTNRMKQNMEQFKKDIKRDTDRPSLFRESQRKPINLSSIIDLNDPAMA